MISKSYVWSDDEDSDDDQLKLNQGKISNVTTLDESLSYSYDKKITSQSDIKSSQSDEEDDYQLHLDNDVKNLYVLSHISPDMSPSKPKTVSRKAQEKLDYFTNNNDRTKIITDDVSKENFHHNTYKNKNNNNNNKHLIIH